MARRENTYYVILSPMMKKLYLLFAVLTLCFTQISSQEIKIAFHNRPLAKVNGKTFSLFDVIKKMDLALYSYDPNMNHETKLQYYNQNWRSALNELVEDELFLAEAEEKELSLVTDG